jgi:hypothetical protein
MELHIQPKIITKRKSDGSFAKGNTPSNKGKKIIVSKYKKTWRNNKKTLGNRKD